MNKERLKIPIPIKNHNWPEGTKPLLHTLHLTYNHENYIAKCIEGVINQRTTFPVQILIHDDFSLDNTGRIIEYYQSRFPSLIKIYLQKENTYRKSDRNDRRKVFNSWRIGKYEAICEGDDYWTDVFKLEKQVQFLESHTDVGLVLTDFDIYIQKKKETHKSIFKSKSKKYPLFLNKIDFLTNTGYLAPLTWVYKTEIARNKIEPNIYYATDYSFSFMLEFFHHSKVAFIEDSTAIYRVLEESASHSNSLKRRIERVKGIYDTQIYYADKFSLDNNHRDIIQFNFIRNTLLLSILMEDQDLFLSLKKLAKLYKFKTFKSKFLIYIGNSPFLTSLMQNIWRLIKSKSI